MCARGVDRKIVEKEETEITKENFNDDHVHSCSSE